MTWVDALKIGGLLCALGLYTLAVVWVASLLAGDVRTEDDDEE